MDNEVIVSVVIPCYNVEQYLRPDNLKYYKQYRKFVCNPAIQESIQKVRVKGAPLKFSIPVLLLKAYCHSLLFIGCWMLHKLGVSENIKM